MIFQRGRSRREKEFEAGEERAFQSIRLADYIDTLEPISFRSKPNSRSWAAPCAHRLQDLVDGSAVADVSLSPSRTCADICRSSRLGHVVRRIIPPADSNVSVQRIAGRPSNHRHKNSGEPSPAHFSESPTTMAPRLLDDTGRADRFFFFVLVKRPSGLAAYGSPP